jgi:hypothetical protein
MKMQKIVTTDSTKHQKNLYLSNTWEIRTTKSDILTSTNGTNKTIDVSENPTISFGPNKLQKHAFVKFFSDGQDLNTVNGFSKSNIKKIK